MTALISFVMADILLANYLRKHDSPDIPNVGGIQHTHVINRSSKASIHRLSPWLESSSWLGTEKSEKKTIRTTSELGGFLTLAMHQSKSHVHQWLNDKVEVSFEVILTTVL